MSVHKISALAAVQEWPDAQAMATPATSPLVVDVRSPSEYALDHLPHAHNWPVLDDEQRQAIGTFYKQVSPFEANKLGAAWVSQNIAKHLLTHVQLLDRNWKPYVYCWRGGQRSGSLAHVLGQVGFTIRLIEGGYKAFRQAMLDDLTHRSGQLRFVVIHGATGTGKTRLLHHLQQLGAQVLDLENLASHRSSVLGQLPGQSQPSQKRFDTLMWQAVRLFDLQRVVFVEAESKKVGNLSIPDSLMAAMRASPCVRLELSLADRVRLLMEDYDYFAQDAAFFCERLDKLIDLKGRALIDDWKARVHAGQTAEVVAELLERHYDPGYESSTSRNFRQYAQAEPLVLAGPDKQAMADGAAQLLRSA
mgnify:CR=1 FL=1